MLRSSVLAASASSTPSSSMHSSSSAAAMSSTSRSKTTTKVRLTVPTGADFALTSPRGFLVSLDISQMDIQSALDQMRSLVSGRPQVVYKTAYYRKQTKNHWARDDPAFLVLQAAFLGLSAIAHSIAFRTTLMGGFSFLINSLLWNWILPGVIVATLGRELANRHLVATAQSSSHVKQTVEWFYAFDIHCNAFFPLFLVLCELL